MTYLNEIVAVIAIILALNAYRGIWPHMLHVLWTEGQSARTYLYASVIVGETLILGRMLYWDVWRSIVASAETSVHGTIANVIFNAMGGLASLLICAALYHLIPKKERRQWNWLTAPWYPNGWRNWPRGVR